MTTTIIPAASFAVDIHAQLTSPFHHGAGSSGNTSLLRTQEVVYGGRVCRVPFLSGASIRHGLRNVLAHHLIDTLGIKDGSLKKEQVDLLFTGGAVSSTGAKTDLGLLRRVEDHWPALMLQGFAAQSNIVTGTLRASDLILVCAENEWRLPEGLHGRKKAAVYRGETFGTRHDQASSPLSRYMDAMEDVKTVQMIWDTQVLCAGAELHGRVSLSPAATPAHVMALKAALALWAPEGEVYLGAKTAQGYGRATLPAWDASYGEALAAYTEHVRENAEAIMTLLSELA